MSKTNAAEAKISSVIFPTMGQVPKALDLAVPIMRLKLRAPVCNTGFVLKIGSLQAQTETTLKTSSGVFFRELHSEPQINSICLSYRHAGIVFSRTVRTMFHKGWFKYHEQFKERKWTPMHNFEIAQLLICKEA